MMSSNSSEMPTKEVFSLIARSVFYSIYRVVICIACVVLALFFLVPMFMGVINIGNITGLILCAVIFIFYTFRMYFCMLKHLFYKAKASRIIWNIIKWCLYAFLIYGLLATILIFAFANVKPQSDSTVIVLGAQVYENGEAGKMLSKRIDSAYEYLLQNENSYCIASGGKGDNEPISEAECIKESLVNKGISDNKIFIEDKSTNTSENIINSYEIIKDKNLSDNLAISTDEFHQLRARIIAYKNGVNSKIGAVSAKTDFYFVPTYVVREWFALPVAVLSH